MHGEKYIVSAFTFHRCGYKTYIGDPGHNVPRETKRRRRRLLDLDSTVTTTTESVAVQSPITDVLKVVNDKLLNHPLPRHVHSNYSISCICSGK